ncbi:hypothetical protein [Burkholderia cepacia]|uniref:hypothetical protein n=1 Tax=Burkholderia cepacia TaxID=292 RepID=UPI0009C0CEF9|nr:hypothetical protein [Burkholderia cepacia]
MKEYFEALTRLREGTSTIVPKGTKITKDAVSLEAGRGKGSIKKSRIQFAELIKCIDEAAIEQRQPRLRHAEHAARTKQSTKELQAALDAALARELSLVLELFELRKIVAKLTGDKLYPIRRR